MFSTDKIPDDLICKSAREDAESDEGVDKAVERFRRLAFSYPQLPQLSLATRKNLIDVAEYLFYWRSDYWNDIVKGGVLAFGLFLHELTERRWYESHHLNPLAYVDQTMHYSKSHSAALIAEHRFLAAVAQSEGHDFSLRQLIEVNPFGDCRSDQWEGDWHIVEKARGGELSPADFRLDKSQTASVQEFFERHQPTEGSMTSKSTVSTYGTTGWSTLTTFFLSVAPLF